MVFIYKMADPIPYCDYAITKAADYLQASLHPKEGFVIVVFDDGNVEGQSMVSNRLTDTVIKNMRELIRLYEAGELPERIRSQSLKQTRYSPYRQAWGVFKGPPCQTASHMI